MSRSKAISFFKEKKKSTQEVINLFSITDRSEMVEQISYLVLAIEALTVKKTDCPWCKLHLRWNNDSKTWWCSREECVLKTINYTKKQLKERTL